MKNVIVTLRVYRGKLNYDASGNVTSENQTVKLKHDTQEYYNFLKLLRTNGYHKVTVEKAVLMAKYNSDEKDEVITDISKYSKEVAEAFTPTIDKPKTQAEIELETVKAELAEIKEIIKGKKVPKEKAPKFDDTPDVNEELEAARKRYHELYGEKPHHMTKLAKLNHMITEKEKE